MTENKVKWTRPVLDYLPSMPSTHSIEAVLRLLNAI